jgi:hypothetical protein
MTKKLCSLFFCCVALSVFAGRAWAIDDTWKNTTGDGLWKTPTNWDMNFVPDCASPYFDKAKLNLMPGPIIDSTTAAKANWIACGDGGTGGLHMTGGTLIVGIAPGDTWTILGYGAADSGTFTIDGGTITTADRVFIGFQGTGVLNMNGGTFNIGGTFGIGNNDVPTTTGRGTVNLAGGTINVAGALTMSSPAGCLGKIDITGGTLNLAGDKRTIVQGFIGSGYIVAFNGTGTVNVSYDGVNTTVTGATNLYKAKGPQPANSAANVSPYATLSWAPGTGVVTHDIYLGTDVNSVRDANTSTAGIYKGWQNSDVNTFNPAGLELGYIYYWRIDEVNNTNVYKGDVWQFAVASFALIDDFEKYADTTAMSASWSNGSTGAALSLAATGGHDNPKTMKFDYSNAGAPFYSETQTSDINYNWTIAGVLAIDIWYKGSAGNAAEQMYAALEDNNSNPVAVIVNSDPAAAQAADWQVWHIKLSDFTGVNLANAKKFYIGFGSRTNPAAGGAGTVYFDDIKLYPSRCINPPATDLNGDCVVDFKDFVIMGTNWLVQSTQ